jgi:hypothetical protein
VAGEVLVENCFFLYALFGTVFVAAYRVDDIGPEFFHELCLLCLYILFNFLLLRIVPNNFVPHNKRERDARSKRQQNHPAFFLKHPTI